MSKDAESGPGRDMHPNSLANLAPQFKDGENHNPKGNNQYTYKDDCEKLFAGQAVDDMAGVIRELFVKALSGNDKHIKLILDRAMPAVQKHDVDVSSTDISRLGDELAARAARRRAQSGTGDDDSGRTEDGG